MDTYWNNMNNSSQQIDNNLNSNSYQQQPVTTPILNNNFNAYSSTTQQPPSSGATDVNGNFITNSSQPQQPMTTTGGFNGGYSAISHPTSSTCQFNANNNYYGNSAPANYPTGPAVSFNGNSNNTNSAVAPFIANNNNHTHSAAANYPAAPVVSFNSGNNFSSNTSQPSQPLQVHPVLDHQLKQAMSANQLPPPLPLKGPEHDTVKMDVTNSDFTSNKKIVQNLFKPTANKGDAYERGFAKGFQAGYKAALLNSQQVNMNHGVQSGDVGKQNHGPKPVCLLQKYIYPWIPSKNELCELREENERYKIELQGNECSVNDYENKVFGYKQDKEELN